MGTLAFLINGLLGVDEEDLCKDYELSSFSGDKNAPLCKRSEGDFPAAEAGADDYSDILTEEAADEP
jgi:hypothetical protein